MTHDLTHRYAHLRPENRSAYGGPSDELTSSSPPEGPPLQLADRYAQGKTRPRAHI